MNKTAKEMFEELGFEQEIETFTTKNFNGETWKDTIDYYSENLDVCIDFDLEFIRTKIYGNEKQITDDIKKAIQKQIEELGWNND